MNRPALVRLVESTGGMPRPSEPTSAVLALWEERSELKKLLNQERTEVARHIAQRMLMAEEIENLKTKHSQELALISGRSAEYKKELTEFREKLENVEEELETTEEDVEFVIAFANQEKEKLVEKIEELRDYIELGEDKNEIAVFNKIFDGTDGDDWSDEE